MFRRQGETAKRRGIVVDPARRALKFETLEDRRLLAISIAPVQAWAYVDLNGDGLPQTGEPGIEGVTITFTDTSGAFLSLNTNPTGRAWFGGNWQVAMATLTAQQPSDYIDGADFHRWFDPRGGAGSVPPYGEFSPQNDIHEFINANYRDLTQDGSGYPQPTFANPGFASHVESWYFAELPKVDLSVTQPVIQQNGDLHATYTIAGGNVTHDSKVSLYWSSGAAFSQAIGSPITSQDIPKGTAPGTHDFDVPASLVSNPPSGATHLLLIIDPNAPFDPDKVAYGRVPETDENNNVEAVQNAKFRLTHLSVHSFVATDSITLRAHIGSSMAGAQVRWTVEGQKAAAGISGFPTDVVTTTDASGEATFTFTPSDNPQFVTNRRTQWTLGAKPKTQRNEEIVFDVVAKYTVDGVEQVERLSDSTLGELKQDEIDVLRQEYFDYNVLPVPTRSEVVTSQGAVNTGNYAYQLSVGLATRYSAILDDYRGRAVTVTIGGTAYNVTIPETAPVTVTSAYRNPQRNKAIGSVHPASKHTLGMALDLQPGAVRTKVVVNGVERRIRLSDHDVLYPALHAAASTQGTAIAEQSAKPVPVGDPRENHIHVQWNAPAASLSTAESARGELPARTEASEMARRDLGFAALAYVNARSDADGLAPTGPRRWRPWVRTWWS